MTEICGIDHDGYGPCKGTPGHIQECPTCGRVAYLVIHSCPALKSDDVRAAEVDQ